MAWDPVPFFVGGGAMHSAEVARLMAYAAFRGNEGIVGPGDLKVSALNVPGAAVNIAPGACVILCRAPGQAYQAYAGRLPTQDSVAIAATGSGAGRSDLIVARVEDPWLAGEPWADPADPTAGPYIFTRVISGVPAGTTDVESLNLGYSAIALARVDIPASTGTITNAMIVDLRKVANPRRERYLDLVFPSGTVDLNTTSYKTLATSRAFVIPKWATRAIVKADLTGAQLNTANAMGGLHITFVGDASQDTVWDENWTGNPSRTSYVAGAEMAIPSNVRGTSQSILLRGNRSAGTGVLRVNSGSTVAFDVEFQERAV